MKRMPPSPLTAAAHLLAAPASSRAQPPPSLHRFLAARWAAVDQMTLALVMCVHASVLFRGSLEPREVLTYRALLVAHASSLALSLAAPATYLRHRSAIISALRLVDLLLLTELVDMQRIHQPASAAAAAAGQRLQAAGAGSCSSSSSASSLAFSLRGMSADGALAALRAWRLQAQGSLQAAVVFMVAITRLHALLACASGAPLRPALHLLVHGTTVGVLCLRSPAGELEEGAERTCHMGGKFSRSRVPLQSGGLRPRSLAVFFCHLTWPRNLIQALAAFGLPNPCCLQPAAATWVLPAPTMPSWWRACSGCCGR